MLLGKVPGGGTRPLVSSAPKSPPKVNDPDTLDEVVVTAKRLASAPADTGEELPEIVVTGRRIPWYAWLLAGATGVFALWHLSGEEKQFKKDRAARRITRRK